MTLPYLGEFDNICTVFYLKFLFDLKRYRR